MCSLDISNANFNRPQAYYYMPSNQPARYNFQPEPETHAPEKTIIAAGLLQGFAMLLQKFSGWCGNKLMQGKEFTNFENIKKIAGNMVNKNRLKVKVDFIDKNNIRNYGQNLQQMLAPVARGENAFYADSLKLAVAPKSKPSLILHELGHAINANKGKFMQFLQKSRGYASAVPTALLVATGLFQRKDNKPNFIERHAGLIGFSAFLPTIVEEGLASLRGLKAAKQTLGKAAKLGPLRRNYFFAWLTYVIAGVGLGVAAKLALLENRRTQ